MTDDAIEIVLQGIDGIDDDLWVPQRLVPLASSLDPLPLELVPAGDVPAPALYSASMELGV